MAPTIESTKPLDGANNVPLDKTVEIYFSEPMVDLTVASTPEMNYNITWSHGNRVATLTHAHKFNNDTTYTIAFAGHDLYNNALGNSPALGKDNKLSFTTLPATPTEAIISNVNINRDGGAGSSVTLNWTVSPAGSKTDLWTKNGDFSPTAADWTKSAADLTATTFTDPGQVASGTAKYYKLLPAGKVLANSDLTKEVVGKFDLTAGVAETEPDKLFISFPLQPIAPKTNSLVDVIGDQIGEGEGLLVFNMNKDVIGGSLYNSGAWGAFPGVPAVQNLELGRAYGFLVFTSRYITIVGKVPEMPANAITLAGGWDTVNDRAATAEWIATAYPMTITLANSGLTESTSKGDSPINGGTIYQFNANADLINGVDGMAVNGTANWVNGSLTAPATLQLVPGKGYMLNEPIINTLTWSQVRPY